MSYCEQARTYLVISFALVAAGLAGNDASAQPAAQDAEFRLGTSGSAYRDLQRTRAVSRRSDGSFVVVWRGTAEGRTGIFAQRYDSAGAVIGTEFRVSGEEVAMRNLSSKSPAVAHTQEGEFVIVWYGVPSADPMADYPQILGRRVGSDGNTIGDEFGVSIATPNGYYDAPDLTAMDDGSFVVVWAGRPDPQQYEFSIMAQRMAKNATKVGTEFIVNTSEGYVSDPQIDTRGNDSFVVVWAARGGELSPPPDGADAGVFGQRFAANASKAGTEFQVNTFTTYAEDQPDLAVHSDGSFVVVWRTQYGDDEPGYGGVFDDSISMQRYDASGARLGEEEHIGVHIAGVQREPAITMEDDGTFVVVWRSAESYNSADDRDDGAGLFGRCFSAAGVGASAEFHVNSYTPGFEREPSIATTGSGEFVVAWVRADNAYSYVTDGYARRFRNNNCASSGGGTTTTTTTTTTLPGGGSTLSVTKTDNDHYWGNDPLIVYDIAVTKESGPTADVVVTERVPTRTTFSAADSTAGWECDPDINAGSICRLTLANVAPEDVRVVSFAVEVVDDTPGTWVVYNQTAATDPGVSLVREVTAPALAFAGYPFGEDGTAATFCGGMSSPSALLCDFCCLLSDVLQFPNPCGIATSVVPLVHGLGVAARTIQSAGDFGTLFRLRDRVLPNTRGGRRFIDLYYTHGPAMTDAGKTNGQVFTDAVDTLDLLMPAFEALDTGDGSSETLTQAQIDAIGTFLDTLVATSPQGLVDAITRERARLEVDTWVGLTADEALARLDRLTCEGYEDELFCGEVTGDCTITATDALRVLRIAVGTAAALPEADLDGNGSTTATDALYTLGIAVGLQPQTNTCNVL